MRHPNDPALPRLGLLLDLNAMSPILERSLASRVRIQMIRLARIAYKPGVRAVVHYEVTVDGLPENAVAFAQPGRDLAARARRPDFLRIARDVDGRSPARTPLVYDADADALLTWLPLDPRLPALIAPPHRLARRLALAGLQVPVPYTEPTIVPESYKPGTRIVLRLGRHVLKAYGRERQFQRGVTGLRLASATPLRTPRAQTSIPGLRLTAQSFVDGSTPTAEEAAAVAGELVRRLQTARIRPARRMSPELVLALAAEKATLTAHLLPELAPRVSRLIGRLKQAIPVAPELVPAHGDFDADQLVDVDGGEPVVLDFDDICLAAPALDLVTYMADVVRGRCEDKDALAVVRKQLLGGYGARPPALDWHLAAVVLARSAHAFQRADPSWEERVRGMVRTAEDVLAA
jgi:hypothetical protein